MADSSKSANIIRIYVFRDDVPKVLRVSAASSLLFWIAFLLALVRGGCYYDIRILMLVFK